MINNEEIKNILEYREDLRQQLKGINNVISATENKIFVVMELIEMHLKQEHLDCYVYSKLIKCDCFRTYNKILLRTDNSKLDVTALKYLSVLIELKEECKVYKDNLKLLQQGIRSICEIERELDKYGKCITGVDYYMNEVRRVVAKIRYIGV